MKRFFITLLVAAALGFAMQTASAGPHRVGGGVHYNRSAASLASDGFDESGISWVFSYQYIPESLVRFEGDIEILPTSLIGGDKTGYFPQLYVLLGGSPLYGGLGIGAVYYDGELGDPVYDLRAGLEMSLVLDKFIIDLNANYRFTEFDQLTDFETDNITVGLMGRFVF
jgi:hypothetical protein